MLSGDFWAEAMKFCSAHQKHNYLQSVARYHYAIPNTDVIEAILEPLARVWE